MENNKPIDIRNYHTTIHPDGVELVKSDDAELVKSAEAPATGKVVREYPQLEKLTAWWKTNRRHLFLIGGYAGCGKTTYARDIPELLGLSRRGVAYLAPTGKAATVLGDAQTIHSFLYHAIKDPISGEIEFIKRNPDGFDEELLIVDEISMVSTDLLADIRELNIPIIGLGDPAQLPPVNGTGIDITKPDILLTKVWRHDGGLLDLATTIRLGKPDGGKYEHVSRKQELGGYINDYDIERDMIICRYNETRHRINNYVRYRLLRYHREIEVGDKIMILKNNRIANLMNGQIATVVGLRGYDEKRRTYDLRIEVGGRAGSYQQNITVNLDNTLKGQQEQFDRPHWDRSIPIDYAYAITCHKAQGSEFPNVWVVREGRNSSDWAHWYYTAVTRARESLILFNRADQV